MRPMIEDFLVSGAMLYWQECVEAPMRIPEGNNYQFDIPEVSIEDEDMFWSSYTFLARFWSCNMMILGWIRLFWWRVWWPCICPNGVCDACEVNLTGIWSWLYFLCGTAYFIQVINLNNFKIFWCAYRLRVTGPNFLYELTIWRCIIKERKSFTNNT